MMKNFTKQQKKTQIEIARDWMVNDVEERGLKKIENLNIKVHKYPSASSWDNHVQGIAILKLSLRKEPDKIK